MPRKYSRKTGNSKTIQKIYHNKNYGVTELISYLYSLTADEKNKKLNFKLVRHEGGEVELLVPIFFNENLLSFSQVTDFRIPYNQLQYVSKTPFVWAFHSSSDSYSGSITIFRVGFDQVFIQYVYISDDCTVKNLSYIGICGKDYLESTLTE